MRDLVYTLELTLCLSLCASCPVSEPPRRVRICLLPRTSSPAVAVTAASCPNGSRACLNSEEPLRELWRFSGHS